MVSRGSKRRNNKKIANRTWVPRQNSGSSEPDAPLQVQNVAANQQQQSGAVNNDSKESTRMVDFRHDYMSASVSNYAVPKGKIPLAIVNYDSLSEVQRDYLRQWKTLGPAVAGYKAHAFTWNLGNIAAVRAMELSYDVLMTYYGGAGKVTVMFDTLSLKRCHDFPTTHFCTPETTDSLQDKINRHYSTNKCCNNQWSVCLSGNVCPKADVVVSYYTIGNWNIQQIAYLLSMVTSGIMFNLNVILSETAYPWKVQASEMKSERVPGYGFRTYAANDSEHWTEKYNEWLLGEHQTPYGNVRVEIVEKIGDFALLKLELLEFRNQEIQNVPTTLDLIKSEVSLYLSGKDRKKNATLTMYMRSFPNYLEKHAPNLHKWYNNQLNKNEILIKLFYCSANDELRVIQSIPDEAIEANEELNIRRKDMKDKGVIRVFGYDFNYRYHLNLLRMKGGSDYGYLMILAILGLLAIKGLKSRVATTIPPFLVTILERLANFLAVILGFIGIASERILPAWAHKPILWLLRKIIGSFFPMALTLTIKWRMPDICAPKELEPMDKTAEVRAPEMLPLHDCESKRSSVLVGYGVSHYLPIRPRTCNHMKMTAIRNRCVLAIDYDEKAVINMPLPNCIVFMARQIEDQVCDVSINQYLDSLGPAKRKRYEQEFEYWLLYGDTYADLSIRRGFPKDEFYLGKPTVSSRLIQSMHVVVLMELGPWMYWFGKRMAEIFDENHPTVFYVGTGSSAEKCGQWFYDKILNGYRMYENDFKHFDASQVVEMIEKEISIYQLSGAPDYVLQYLCYQLETRGIISGGWKFKVEGRRGSGVSNTSVGNTMNNVTATLNALRAQNIHESDVCFLVLGDDIVIASRKQIDCDTIVSEFRQYGLESTFFEREDPRDVEFCSSLFWPVEDGYILGPKPGRVLSKTFWNKKQLSEEEHYQWLNGVCKGLQKSCSGIPLLGRMLDAMISATSAHQGNILQQEYNIYAKEYHQVSEEGKEMFERRYGINPDDIETPAIGLLFGEPWHTITSVDNGGESNLWLDLLQYLPQVSTYIPMLFPSVMSYDFEIMLYSVFGAPIIEEAFKRLCPEIFAPLLALYECHEKGVYDAHSIARQICLHVVLTNFGYKKGVIAHSLWNMFVYYMHLCYGAGIVASID